MRRSLLCYLAGQPLPATVAGASGVAAVQGLVQDGHVKAVMSASRSSATAHSLEATVTEFTRQGLRELRRTRTAASLQ